jgi:hypothetical protein
MKPILALFLALAATSYAQFAVMHTNGVLVSPTNLTIPQSSVSGLSSALDSKLGTNPTLAISNTAGLQSALDGKLATNGTLAVSNVSGLQSALDGKLATNGSAAGLSGFVGTTNAETARGNLGISNTFAGQFTADFYDDFSRYSNGTQFTNGASPVIGSNYVLRSGAFINNNHLPFITNGTLTGTNTAVWYLSSELSRPVYNFGMEWTWETGKNADLAWPVIIVRPDDAWLDKLLHIVVSPLTINIDVAITNGAGGLVTIATTNFGWTFARLEPGVRHILTGEIEGNTVRVKVGGRTLEVTDSRIGEVVGRYFTYEYFGNFPSTNVANIFWHRVWANSPNMMEFSSQPFSPNLINFANGDARVTRYLTVGTNRDEYNNQLSADLPVFIDGGVKVKGRLRGFISENTYGDAPLRHFYNGASANTNTTNRTALWTRNLAENFLAEAGQRWEVTAVGSFANNTNQKRVVFQMGGGSQLDTGNITDTGEWRINALIYRTSTNTHEAFAMFQSETTTKMARWTYNFEATWILDIEASATSNNEVLLRSAWTDWYP